jgi:hypothetical protein
MTEPVTRALGTAINSDFVEGMTMSFSLYAMVAETPKKQNSQPQNSLRPGADASAIHGRLGCSGCTPAEPYPPNRENKHIQSARPYQSKKPRAAAGLHNNNQPTSPVLLLNQIK